MLQRPLVSPGHIRCRLRSWKAAVVTNVSPQQWKNVAECAIIGVSQPCQYLLRRWLPLWDVANQEQNEHRDVPDAYKNCQLCHSGANLYISYICLINSQVDLEDKYDRNAVIKWYHLNVSFGGLINEFTESKRTLRNACCACPDPGVLACSTIRLGLSPEKRYQDNCKANGVPVEAEHG